MKKYLFIHHIWKDLFCQRRFTLLFILNLSLGLCGFIAIDGFHHSLKETLNKRTKTILGADLAIQARRRLSESEKEVTWNIVKRHIKNSKRTSIDLTKLKMDQSSQVIEFYSMVRGKEGLPRLVQIKAIDRSFPFYGKIELKNQRFSSKILHEAPYVLVYPELLLQLKLKVGDYLQLGQKDFLIKDVVLSDPSAGLSTNMAPRIYVGVKYLMDTQLLRPGGVGFFNQLFHLPHSTEKKLEMIAEEIILTFEKKGTSDIRVFTYKRANRRMERPIKNLNKFLGLASLCALFMASIGAAFLFRSYIRGKTKEMAIWMALGQNRTRVFLHYLIQLLLLGAFSALISLLLSWSIVPLFLKLTQGILPFPIDFSIRYSTPILALLLGSVGSVLICLPLIMEIKGFRPGILLTERSELQKRNLAGLLLGSTPALLAFLGLSLWQANSLRLGLIFYALFSTSGILLGGLAYLLFTLLGKKKISTGSLALNWAIRDICRHKMASISCFLALALGISLINLIPQIKASLNQELKRPGKSKLPDLFLFDIQEDQVKQLKDILKREKVELDQLSPMIRAKLIRVNGVSFEEINDRRRVSGKIKGRRSWMRGRGYNLSYRKKIIKGEEIVEGRYFKGPYNEEYDLRPLSPEETGVGKEREKKLPEISLEQRFAGRQGLKINDIMTFDIQGVEVTGKVTSLRKIRWTTFRPNFFVQFQPGVLEEAPKTWLASILRLSTQRKNHLQRLLTDKLPNITHIDVRRLVSRLLSIMEQMEKSLLLMSVLCLIAGVFVVYSMANHRAQTQRYEIGLLKSLGAEFSLIRNSLLWQFALLTILAGIWGTLTGIVLSYVISSLIFEDLWVLDINSLFGPFIIIFIVVLMASYMAIRKGLLVRSSLLLK